ncbi:MAG: CRISPR-associated protein [Sulfurovum sp.]|nr:CRISPR-associated protein [Sulfurovum sp.]
MTLKYEINFLDYWHVGSGLSAGAKLDALVLKDNNKLPFVGGKTIKGLVREMVELLDDDALVDVCFGTEGVSMGSVYFSNATLSNAASEQIIAHALQGNLYDEIASTAINAQGMAVKGSLREIEVTVPVTLIGTVEDVSEEQSKNITQALMMIKRIGLNRNRGLGRCQITVEVA